MFGKIATAFVVLTALAGPAAADESSARPATILVLDVSNSMWGQIDGVSKIEIARDAVGDLLAHWDPKADLGLVAYGHRRAGDCSDIEYVIRVGPVDAAAFKAKVDSLVPRGKTPLTEAVRDAAEILNYADVPATVILVSDGIESCKADPCKLAVELERGGVNFTAHVIGFDVARIADQRQLSCLADETGGEYLTADNAMELTEALRTVAAPPPPPMVHLFAAAEEGGPAIDDEAIRWTVVSLDTEESILDAETMAQPALDLEPGRYFARAEMDGQAGDAQFEYSGESELFQGVILSAAATLEAAPAVEAGADIAVSWTGPGSKGDFIMIVEPTAQAGAHGNYTYAREGSPLSLRAPDEPGAYELRYVAATGRKTLARRPITVQAVQARLEAAPTAAAGTDISVDWTGPDNDGDYLTIVETGAAEGAHGNYDYTHKGSPLAVRAPDDPGSYELRYVTGQARKTLATLPITVTAVEASLEAPPVAPAGSEIPVTWTGPDNRGDYITVVAPDASEGDHGAYDYTRKGSPLAVRAPDEPGSYELRYVTGQARKTLARLPIEVTAVKATLEAAPAVPAGSPIPVTWTGPDNKGDLIGLFPTAAPDSERPKLYAYTRKGSPVEIRSAETAGNYELRYLTGHDRKVLARLPVTLTEVTATLEAAPVVEAGHRFDVPFTGPANRGDLIAVAEPDAKPRKMAAHAYAEKRNPATLKAPKKPGRYELRYITARERKILARLPITVK